MDNTLYLVCVVTRGSSWRSATSGGLAGSSGGSSVLSQDSLDIDGRMPDEAAMLTQEQDGGFFSESNSLYSPSFLQQTDEDYDIQALEALGMIRTERNAPQGPDEDQIYDDVIGVGDAQAAANGGVLSGFAGIGEGQSTLFLLPEWMTGQSMPNYTEDPMLLNFPSSNDTDLLILKPMVVNLGSKSSKCTEIKTPVDPHKIRFIDNKRISIIIGCVAGILVFIFIIISIVMNREEKEDETAEEESLSGSAVTQAHKSPGSKTNRSDSLGFTPGRPGLNTGSGGAPIMARRMSRNNSQSSSLLNNRLSLAEAAGPDALPPRHVRNGSSVGMPTSQPQSQPHSASGTLKRGTLSRQQSQRDNAPPQVILLM